MDLITTQDIRVLLNEHPFPCISMFMPTIQAGETNQNHIRFKDLTKEAENQLAGLGMRRPDIQNLLKPANDLLNDPFFWEHQSQGLAAYLASDLFETYRLPVDFEQQLDIGPRFIIHPLLPLLGRNEQFYILALSQDENRLLSGDRYQIREVLLDEMPSSLAQAMANDRDHPETDWEYRKAVIGSNETAGSFHGQGEVKNEHKVELLRYFRKIDTALQDYLGENRVPLVLAGVEEILPLYREASDYQYITDESITGNPSGMKDKELQQRAWKIIAPRLEKDQKTAGDLFRQWAHTKRASSKPEEIIPAAYYGRVEYLFIPKDIQLYGTFDPMTGETRINPPKTEQDQNLIDLAASYTFLNDGRVYVVDPDQMPAPANLAAVFRYEMNA